MSAYQKEIESAREMLRQRGAWNAINPESVARMRLQNRFKTGLDIARYTADIMRRDMAAYDADPANYTQSLGCWHGFIGAAEADLDQEALRHAPSAATSTCRAGWSPRCAPSSARCPTSRCTRRPACRR